MTPIVENLKIELSQLSLADRSELAQFLIHSLSDGIDQDAGTAWDIEVTQRMQQIRSGRASGQPLESVLAELRQKYS